MNKTYNYVMYSDALFGNADPALNETQAIELSQSGFEKIIMQTLHIGDNGSLYYNNLLAVEDGRVTDLLNSALTSSVARLKKEGTVRQVFMNIGGGKGRDFAVAAEFLSAPGGRSLLVKNFSALVRHIALDGFDLEPGNCQAAACKETVSNLTLLLNHSFGMGITYSTCGEPTPWNECLAAVYTQNENLQIVESFNLQCAADDCAGEQQQWISAIENYPAPLGIADTKSFVLTGFLR